MRMTPFFVSDRRCIATLATLLTLPLAGCATLPSSGPTGGQLVKAANAEDGTGFPVVHLNSLADLPVEAPRAAEFLPDYAPPPTDLIGPGDVLDIAIYEAGVALFGNATSTGITTPNAANPVAQVERLPAYRVDDNGYIRVPFAGALKAAGRTTAQIEGMIRAALRGMSQNPQVQVTVREMITNSVIIGGEVGRPGRLVLPTNRETLSDVIALAGGYRGDAKDISLRVQRHGRNEEFRLSDVLNGADRDMRIYPGDKVVVIRAPRTFSVMGAPGRVEQITFTAPSLALSEAVALAGGTNPNLGDPKAIFVFRFVKDEQGKETPMLYHVNMMQAGAYFVSQRFVMHDKDVLYVGNAEANQPSKMIQIISQLFAPIVTIRDIARSTN